MGHASKALGDRTSDLTYTPITPCRIVDTRFGGGGILNAGDTRDWLAATPAGNFSAQGGSTTDCGIPVKPAAVLANFTVANTQSSYEFLSAWPFWQPRPNSSVLNWVVAGTQVANAVIVPLCSSAVGCPVDFSVYVSGAAHVIVDVMGYFKAPDPMNVVWVAKAGAPFSTIQAAIDHASLFASAATPYLIKVAPGTYTERITVPDHLQIEGSGRNITTITSLESPATVHVQATRQGTEMRNISIHNGNSTDWPVAVLVETAARVRFVDVAISTANTSTIASTAVAASTGSVELASSTVTASGSNDCVGVVAGQLALRDSKVSVSCDAQRNHAVQLSGTSKIAGSEIMVAGGQIDSIALMAGGGATVQIDNSLVAASAKPGGSAVSLSTGSFAEVRVRGSVLDASGGIYNRTVQRTGVSFARVAHCELRAPTTGEPLCFGNYDASLVPVNLCQ